MKRRDAFEEFLLTERGQKLLACGVAYKPGQEYFKNILWWAFQAGAVSDDIRPSQTGRVLRELSERGTRAVTKSTLRAIDEIIKDSQL